MRLTEAQKQQIEDALPGFGQIFNDVDIDPEGAVRQFDLIHRDLERLLGSNREQLSRGAKVLPGSG